MEFASPDVPWLRCYAFDRRGVAPQAPADQPQTRGLLADVDTTTLDPRCPSIRCMRTTLSIDDDVIRAVRERAKRERRTVGEVLSDLARQALTGRYGAEPGAAPESFHGFEPFPHRGPAVSNELIDQLREEEVA